MADSLELYKKLVATIPGVEVKGATVPYTSINGNMFSYLSKEGKLELRLPEPERAAFLKKYKAKLCEAYGKVQPEYVEVPDSLLARTKELEKFFECQSRLRNFAQAEANDEAKAVRKNPNPTVSIGLNSARKEVSWSGGYAI